MTSAANCCLNSQSGGPLFTSSQLLSQSLLVLLDLSDAHAQMIPSKRVWRKSGVTVLTVAVQNL